VTIRTAAVVGAGLAGLACARALLLEQSDEWVTQRARTMTVETIGAVSEPGPARLSAVSA